MHINAGEQEEGHEETSKEAVSYKKIQLARMHATRNEALVRYPIPRGLGA